MRIHLIININIQFDILVNFVSGTVVLVKRRHMHGWTPKTQGLPRVASVLHSPVILMLLRVLDDP